MTPSKSNALAQVMWHSLTPNAKKKMKLNVSSNSDGVINEAFRSILRVNLSNQVSIRSTNLTPIKEKIEFF